MRKKLIICILAGVLIGGVTYPVMGFETTPGVLTDHEKMLKYKDQQAKPYAMNYADEAAQTIGVHDGRWDVIDSEHSRSGLMPNVSGAVDRGHPMLKLQWRLGQ